MNKSHQVQHVRHTTDKHSGAARRKRSPLFFFVLFFFLFRGLLLRDDVSIIFLCLSTGQTARLDRRGKKEKGKKNAAIIGALSAFTCQLHRINISIYYSFSFSPSFSRLSHSQRRLFQSMELFSSLILFLSLSHLYSPDMYARLSRLMPLELVCLCLARLFILTL